MCLSMPTGCATGILAPPQHCALRRHLPAGQRTVHLHGVHSSECGLSTFRGCFSARHRIESAFHGHLLCLTGAGGGDLQLLRLICCSLLAVALILLPPTLNATPALLTSSPASQGGSLAALLSWFGPLDERVICIYTRQVLQGRHDLAGLLSCLRATSAPAKVR